MSFDANTFMNQTVDAPGDTEGWLPEEGDYRAMFGDIAEDKSFRSFTSDKNGKDYTVFEPSFALADDPRLVDAPFDPVNVRHKGVFLDFDPTSGQLDMRKGRNIDLNRMRDTVGQNVPGWTFSQLSGAGPVMVHVTHEEDKKSKRKFARVDRVVKIG